MKRNKIQINKIYGDLKCIGSHYNEHNKKLYDMQCIKCNRIKSMHGYTINHGLGTSHFACGHGAKNNNKAFHTKWKLMRAKTCSPSHEQYDLYGGRGIRSDEFENFIDFYDAMFSSFIEKAKEIGENNIVLRRMDVSKDFSKSNCYWGDKRERK